MSWPDWLWVDVSDDVDRCGTAFELPIVLHEIRTRSYSSGYHPLRRGHTQLSPPHIALRLPLHYIHYRPVIHIDSTALLETSLGRCCLARIRKRAGIGRLWEPVRDCGQRQPESRDVVTGPRSAVITHFDFDCPRCIRPLSTTRAILSARQTHSRRRSVDIHDGRPQTRPCA